MAKIAVDIGHGIDTFPPSKGVYRGGKGYAEHAFNAKVGMEIKKLLEANGHTVILGQQPNRPDVPLRTRTNLYNREKVDLVISTHANWNSDSNVNGRCVFYWGTSRKSKDLAVAIRDEIKKQGYSTHGDGMHAGKRGSWTNLHINRETKMPAVLVEYGFMSGNKDFELVFGSKQVEYIRDMANATVRGIQAWLGKDFKDSKTVTPQTSKPKPAPSTNKSISVMADEVEKGVHGNGHANRQKSLGVNDATYGKVRAEVNRRAGGTSKPKKSVTQMAKEVRDGKHGNGHANRRKSLDISKAEYGKVRAEVNRQEGVFTPSKPTVRKGTTVTARRLYTTSDSTKNVRSSNITGYVDTINNGWRNEIRLRNRKGGHYIGFTRKQDLV